VFMSKSRAILCLLSSLVVCASLSFAATADRISGGITGGPAVTLRGNIHHLAMPQFDQGSVDPAMQLGTITLVTVPTPAQQQALKQLLAQQQNRKSPLYHKWLTPEQYADRFGLSKNDIQQLAAWLQGQGFTMVHAARGRNWVSFTGTAAQVQGAFATEIHRYSLNGELHYANATEPKIPQTLSGLVLGFRGLNDFRPRPRSQRRVRPDYYSSSLGDFVAPGDLATIYDISALYNAGIDGTGQKIAVMGQTDIYLADLNDFRSGFGLSSLSCTTNTNGVITACSDPHFQYLLDGSDPGLSTHGDISESDLDLEWSGAVASGAQIIFVNSTDTFTSFYYAIDNSVAPVISLSYGECEFDDNLLPSDEVELQKANSEGITFVNSSGDSGAAECDSVSTVTAANLATQGLAVSYPASSPEVTGAGGTGVLLADWNSPTYWGTTNGTTGGSALSYVPEVAWNDDLEISEYCQANPTNTFCTQGGTTKVTGWVPITSEATAQTDIGLSSVGGGASNCSVQNSGFTACISGFPQPSWQTVTVSGAPSVRLSPDVSFFASPNFPGYVFCTPLSELSSTSNTASSCASGITTAVNTNLSIIGGTSASAPVLAGVVALLNQYLAGSPSPGLGNINPTLYALAATPSNGAFNHVDTGDNNVSCVVGTPSAQPVSLQCPASGVIGYSASNSDATTGYNLVAGLGSMDVNKFAVAWAASRLPSTATLTTSTNSTFLTASVTLTATVFETGSSSPATGNVTFENGTSVLGTAALSSGTATLNTTALPVGTDTITAIYNGNATLATATSTSATVTVATPFTLTPTATSFQVAQGSNVNATVALAITSGFSGMVAFTCSDPASASICTAPPNTNVSGPVTFQITTTAPTSKLQRPMDRGTRIFYAALLPGLMGIVFAGSRKRSLRGMRLLAMLMLLGVSTLWMASCGGSNSGNTTTNPGTPTGTYTINVTGASGGATATSSFQLVVQ
jgi:subtilase family serine protease